MHRFDKERQQHQSAAVRPGLFRQRFYLTLAGEVDREGGMPQKADGKLRRRKHRLKGVRTSPFFKTVSDRA